MVSRRRFVCSAEHFRHVPIPQSSTIFERNIPTISVHLIIYRQCPQVSFSSKWNSWNGWRNDLTSFNAKHVVFFMKLKATNKPLMFWIPHIRNDVWKTQNQNKNIIKTIVSLISYFKWNESNVTNDARMKA